MTIQRHDDDEPPGRREDPRVIGVIHQREVRPAIRRRRQKDNAVTIRRPSVRGRARFAAAILSDFGDPDCPRDEVPSGELVAEARRALGWNQAQASWLLGFEHRTSQRMAHIEQGRRPAPRHLRLILVRALQDLAAQQRTMR